MYQMRSWTDRQYTHTDHTDTHQPEMKTNDHDDKMNRITKKSRTDRMQNVSKARDEE